MFNKYLQHPLHTPPTPSDSISGGEPTPCIWYPFPAPGKTQRFLQKLLFFFLTKKKTLWYHFIDVQCPRIREKRDPGHHLHKGARNFERKSNGSPHSVSQSFRRCRLSFEAMYVFFFTHFSISTTFGHTLKRLFYYKVNFLMGWWKASRPRPCYPVFLFIGMNILPLRPN